MSRPATPRWWETWPDDLLRQADIALYQAKAAGKDQAVLFNPEMSARAVERWALENDLSRALARHLAPVDRGNADDVRHD